MNRISRVPLLVASLGMAFLVAACDTPPPTSPSKSTADGTWSGQDPTRTFDFNAPLNWVPRGVPSGTANVPAESPPVPFLRFTEPATNLGAVRLTGKLGMTVEADKTVTALPGGLTLCCSEAHALIEGVFVGDVTLGDNALPGNNQVSGSGTIKGSVIQFGGTFGSSKSISGSQVLKVVGNYRIIQPRAALLTEVFPDSAGRIEVAGTASLNGGLLFIAVDDKVKGAVPPFKVLTASGINGKFGSVIVYPPGSYAADVAYNAQDVTVTLRK